MCGPDIQWYISGGTFLSWHNDTHLNGVFENVARVHRVDHKLGTGGHGAIGFILDCWRLELEGTFRRNRNACIKENNLAVQREGAIKDVALLLNGTFNYPIFYNLSFYIGAGAGVSRSELHVPAFKEKDTVFAWQILTGFTYTFCEDWDLLFGYRYFQTAKGGYDGGTVSNFPHTNDIDLGLRLRF